MASTFINPVLLQDAIKARLIASMAHADIGVNVQGVFAHMSGSNIEAARGSDPYIVFDLIRGDFIGEFGADGIDAVYRVTVHDHPENGGANAAKAFEGVWGNWAPATGGQPDYGLHMWTPTVAGLDVCDLVARSFSTPHTPTVLSYQMMFELKSYNKE